MRSMRMRPENQPPVTPQNYQYQPKVGSMYQQQQSEVAKKRRLGPGDYIRMEREKEEALRGMRLRPEELARMRMAEAASGQPRQQPPGAQYNSYGQPTGEGGVRRLRVKAKAQYDGFGSPTKAATFDVRRQAPTPTRPYQMKPTVQYENYGQPMQQRSAVPYDGYGGRSQQEGLKVQYDDYGQPIKRVGAMGRNRAPRGPMDDMEQQQRHQQQRRRSYQVSAVEGGPKRRRRQRPGDQYRMEREREEEDLRRMRLRPEEFARMRMVEAARGAWGPPQAPSRRNPYQVQRNTGMYQQQEPPPGKQSNRRLGGAAEQLRMASELLQQAARKEEAAKKLRLRPAEVIAARTARKGAQQQAIADSFIDAYGQPQMPPPPQSEQYQYGQPYMPKQRTVNGQSQQEGLKVQYDDYGQPIRQRSAAQYDGLFGQPKLNQQLNQQRSYGPPQQESYQRPYGRKVDRKLAGPPAASTEDGVGRERRLKLAELRKRAQAEQLRKALEEARAGSSPIPGQPQQQPWQEPSAAEYSDTGPDGYAPTGVSMGGPAMPMPPIDDDRRNRSPGLQNNFYETPTSDFKRPYTGAKRF